MDSCAMLVCLMAAVVASARGRSIECSEACQHGDERERPEDVQPAASVNYVGGGRGDGTVGDGGYVNQGVGLGGTELAGGVPGGIGLDGGVPGGIGLDGGAFPLDFDGDHQVIDRPPLGLHATPGGGQLLGGGVPLKTPVGGSGPPGTIGVPMYTSIVNGINGLGGIGAQGTPVGKGGAEGVGGAGPLAGLAGGVGSPLGKLTGGAGGPIKGLLGGGSADGGSGVLGSLLGKLKGGQWGLYFGNVLMQAIGTLIKGAQEVLAGQLAAGTG